MKEAVIRKKAIEILEKDGYITWYPPKVRWRQERDVFGMFDIIATYRNIIRFIQITTISNLSHRRKKIKKWMKENNIKWNYPPEIWAYHKKKKEFKIEKL